MFSVTLSLYYFNHRSCKREAIFRLFNRFFPFLFLFSLSSMGQVFSLFPGLGFLSIFNVSKSVQLQKFKKKKKKGTRQVECRTRVHRESVSNTCPTPICCLRSGVRASYSWFSKLIFFSFAFQHVRSPSVDTLKTSQEALPLTSCLGFYREAIAPLGKSLKQRLGFFWKLKHQIQHA